MRVLAAAALVILGVAGCTGPQLAVSPEEGERIARQCMEDSAAPGTYSLSLNVRGRSYMDRLPKASPVVGLGGTQAGADAINSCTLTRAGGGTYEVETVPGAGTTAVNYTYGTPPSKTTGVRDREETPNDMRRAQDGRRAYGCTQDAPVIYGGALYCLSR